MLKKLIYKHGQKVHAVRRIELNYIRKYLKPKHKEIILDVGCGKGGFCNYLYSKGVICFGIDPLDKDIKIAKKYQNKNINFLVASGEKIPFEKETFDKVVSVCVLEHVNDDNKFLSEIYRVLKKNGIFVASLDCLNSKHFSEEYKEFYSKEFKVNRFYSFEKIKKILDKNGFELVSYKYLFSGFLCSLLIRLFSHTHFRGLFILFFPLIYTIFFIKDKLNNLNAGFMLVIKAIKK